MFFTVLILFLTALVLSVLLWAGAVWLQTWLYEAPAGDLYWRRPAVGVGLAAFYALWVIVDCRTGGHCGSLFKSVSTLKQYDQIGAVVKRNGKDSPEETYRKEGADFMLVGPDGRVTSTKLPEAPERIIIKDADATAVFEPERDAKGNFKRETGQNLHYYDIKSGRTIDEGDLGRVQQFHWGWLIWNVLFNVLHLGLWFAGLWLVLRFQWGHALGFAVCLWLVMTLFPIPMIFDYVEKAFQVVK